MTIEYVTANILDLQEGVILQGLNCQYRMASGLAGQTAHKWPHVYTDYKVNLSRLKADAIDPLGHVVITPIINNVLWHIGGFTQTYYGRDPRVKYANPRAITNVILNAFDFCHINKVPVLSTVRIGAGLGGLEPHEFDTALQTAFDIYKVTTPEKTPPIVHIYSPLEQT